ncbi:hypothetical protein GCM10009539_75150 [Cryptosporangium japonicum]|uniref:HEAT repeat domain-containing protein n=2 Tax=Cryptosporangium japonicum TaxID=80872 RepID=A0ABN0V5E4_9ACTN
MVSRPRDLAATIIAGVLRTGRWQRWGVRYSSPFATHLWRVDGSGWSRLFVAGLLSDPLGHSDDARHLPDLFRRGWTAGGYHLRLQMLAAAESAASELEPAVRDRMIEELEGCETENIFLSTQLIEALAAYGQIEPIFSLEQIQEAIATVLAAESSPETAKRAVGIVGQLFERERIVGPYSEAIGALPESRRLRLFALAALAEGPNFADDWVVAQVADAADQADPRIIEALARHARVAPVDTFMPQIAVGAHLHALRGWAGLFDELPPAADAETPGPLERAWRCIDGIILALYRNPVDLSRAEALWDLLRQELPAAAVTVLYELQQADFGSDDRHMVGHRELCEAFPRQLLALLDWALEHRDEVSTMHHRADQERMDRYVIGGLAQLGDTATVTRLQAYASHPDLVDGVIEAIRAINRRTP